MFLAISSNDKWGVVSQANKRIVNFLYDNISIIQDKLVVAKDSKIGVLDVDGSILITPSYNKIECVTIDDGTYGGVYGPLSYGKYNKECVFDTEDESKLLRIEISYYKSHNRHHISVANGSKFDFEKGEPAHKRIEITFENNDDNYNMLKTYSKVAEFLRYVENNVTDVNVTVNKKYTSSTIDYADDTFNGMNIYEININNGLDIKHLQ